MRILIVDNSSVTYKNGMHYTNALNGLFLDELVELGNVITYFQFHSYPGNDIRPYNLEEHDVECISVSCKGNKIGRYIKAYKKVVKVIKRSGFVYFYYPTSFKYIAVLCGLLRKPFGLYIRGMNGLNDKLSYYLYKHSYTIFTVSDYFTNMVNSTTCSERAHTIRPMIPYTDVDIITNREYRLKDEYTILFLGRIAKDKGLVELVSAVKKLHESAYRFKLQIVGSGEFSLELSQLITKLNIEDIVSFEGPVFDNNKKADYYQKADIYVLPTYHEGFPRTLYEAMIFGTPIITTFVGGIPALMKNGENSKRIEPCSVESIVDGLSYAMDNYMQMAKMAMNATKLVSKIVDRRRLTHAQHLNSILSDYGK